MLSNTLQLFTLLAANLIIDAPAVSSQALAGLPDLAGLNLAGLNLTGLDLSGLDPCSLTCSMTAYTSAMQACPSMTDVACFCKNPDFIRINKACVASTCPPSYLPQAATFAIKTCASVGVTLPAFAIANSPPANPVATASASAASPIAQIVQAPVNAAATTPAATVTAAAPSVPATSSSAVSVPVVNNVVHPPTTPATAASTSTITNPASAANKDNTSASGPVLSTPVTHFTTTTPQTNGTLESIDTAESSASSSVRATGFFMVGATLVTFLML